MAVTTQKILPNANLQHVVLLLILVVQVIKTRPHCSNKKTSVIKQLRLVASPPKCFLLELFLRLVNAGLCIRDFLQLRGLSPLS